MLTTHIRAIADVAGRRLTLIATFTVFLGACIGLALSQEYYQLVILRCLQSFGSASTIAIGSGMVGDVSTREQRGGYMGIFQTGSLLPLGASLSLLCFPPLHTSHYRHGNLTLSLSCR